MTDHQPPADSRASAWVGAWDRLEAAQKLKTDHRNRVIEPLPELYWATLAEAAIYADLARADQTTGFLAGAHLVGRHDRIRRADRREFERLFGGAAAQDQCGKQCDCHARLNPGYHCSACDPRGDADHHCEYDDPSKCRWPGHRR